MQTNKRENLCCRLATVELQVFLSAEVTIRIASVSEVLLGK